MNSHGPLQGALEVVCSSSSPPPLAIRSLQPCDYTALKALHQELFPIDYDEAFYNKATNSKDRLFSFAALSRGAQGQEELVGFVTARLMYAYECDPADRYHLGLSSATLSHVPIVYILTLGVTHTWQKRGIAKLLLQHVHHRAQMMRWHAVFLHVVSYNAAAIRLYTNMSYRCAAFLQNFYTINSGRQIYPDQIHYDAYLYVLHIDDMVGSMRSMLGLSVFNWAPLRAAWGACMPWFCSGGNALWQRPGSRPNSAAGIAQELAPPNPQPGEQHAHHTSSNQGAPVDPVVCAPGQALSRQWSQAGVNQSEGVQPGLQHSVGVQQHGGDTPRAHPYQQQQQQSYFHTSHHAQHQEHAQHHHTHQKHVLHRPEEHVSLLQWLTMPGK